MKRLFLLLDKWISYLSQGGRVAGCSLVVITTLLITVHAISRYLFNYPFLFADEYARYLLVGIVYLGLGYTLRTGAHVRADFVIVHLSKRTRTILDVSTSSFGTLVIVFMLWYGWKVFLYNLKSHIVSITPMQTPLWIPSLLVVIGLVIFLLDMLVHIVRGIKSV